MVENVSMCCTGRVRPRCPSLANYLDELNGGEMEHTEVVSHRSVRTQNIKFPNDHPCLRGPVMALHICAILCLALGALQFSLTSYWLQKGEQCPLLSHHLIMAVAQLAIAGHGLFVYWNPTQEIEYRHILLQSMGAMLFLMDLFTLIMNLNHLKSKGAMPKITAHWVYHAAAEDVVLKNESKILLKLLLLNVSSIVLPGLFLFTLYMVYQKKEGQRLSVYSTWSEESH